MELRVLGAVQVCADGQVLSLGRPQQGVVLAALVADVGQPVPVETLVDRVWDDAPPQQARRLLHTQIARVRKVLERASALDGEPASVLRKGSAYVLEVWPGSVDLYRFRELVSRAGAVGCGAADRAGLLREALDLWRGEPLAGLSGHWVEQTRQLWGQQRLQAVLQWADAALDCGDPGAVLPQLGELVVQHPLVESMAAMYMRVLHASGRPADALEHYGIVRRRLADELGIDPSAELQQLYQHLLNGDPEVPVHQTVPRQLPAPPQLFTGRITELAALGRMRDVSTVVITAIDGMAGVGKTTLAVHAAHRIAGDYPDGQLFIDLHGYTQGVEPVDPSDALEHLLRALGVPGPQIPDSLDQRAALYRSRLAEQRMLIVLDNAATESQVQPLLPGSAGSLVLVTSRRRLSGLDHTHTLSLDTLPVRDAVELFTCTVGERRLAGHDAELAELVELVELVELCGRLPLAIRIAAARLRSRPTWRLSDLAARLRDRRHRLGELEAGQRSVIAALDLSYQQLNPRQQPAGVVRCIGCWTTTGTRHRSRWIPPIPTNGSTGLGYRPRTRPPRRCPTRPRHWPGWTRSRPTCSPPHDTPSNLANPNICCTCRASCAETCPSAAVTTTPSPSTTRHCSPPVPPATGPVRWTPSPVSATSTGCRAGISRPPSTSSRRRGSPRPSATARVSWTR